MHLDMASPADAFFFSPHASFGAKTRPFKSHTFSLRVGRPIPGVRKLRFFSFFLHATLLEKQLVLFLLLICVVIVEIFRLLLELVALCLALHPRHLLLQQVVQDFAG